jgi:hypothetical protein
MIRKLVISLMLVVGIPSIGLTQSNESSIWYYENVSEDEDYILSLILGEFEASISVGTPKCLGDFSGIVTKHDDRLTVIDPNRRLSGPECEFTLWPQGDRAFWIEQGEGCTPYHGAMCSLQGYVELQRTSQPSSEAISLFTFAENYFVEELMNEGPRDAFCQVELNDFQFEGPCLGWRYSDIHVIVTLQTKHTIATGETEYFFIFPTAEELNNGDMASWNGEAFWRSATTFFGEGVYIRNCYVSSVARVCVEPVRG